MYDVISGRIGREHPILFIHKDHALNPEGPNGGAETAVLAVALALSDQGYQVFLAAELHQSWRESAERQYQGLNLIDLGPDFDTEGARIEFEEIIGSARYHLIVSCRAQAMLESRRNQRVLSRIFISHEPTAGAFGVQPRVLAKVADRVIAVSEIQKAQLVEAGCPEEQVAVIHNGVDQLVFRPGVAANRDYMKLVFAGAIVIDKGVHLLIQAFMNLKARMPKLSLDIYGSAELWNREPYIDINQLKQLPGLTFHGSVEQRVIADAFREAGLAVLPSIYFDAFNLVAAEAQACGLPVVGSYQTGMREIIEDGVSGVLLKDVSADALTATLENLLSNPSRLEAMSHNALERIRPKFTWQRSAEQFLRIMGESMLPVVST